MNLVFGASGGIGSVLCKQLVGPILCPSRMYCDVRSTEAVRVYLDAAKPSVIYFCAGIMSDNLMDTMAVNVLPLQTIDTYYRQHEQRPACVILSSTCRCSRCYPEYAASMAARSAFALSTGWMHVMEIGGCRTSLRSRIYGPEPDVNLLDPGDVATKMVQLASSKAVQYCVMEAHRA